jgi:glycosyltransferase involved in cell wall biosynthesis
MPKVTNDSSKRVLIINQYYAPDRSATAGVLGRIVKVISSKANVIVLAGRPSYMPAERHQWKIYYSEKHRNVEILRVGSTAYKRYNLFKRLANYFSYCLLCIPVAVAVKADLIFSMTDPPLAGFIGALVAMVRRKPFIYYIQDLHPDMAIAAGMIRVNLLTKIWEKLHVIVIKRANKIFVIGEDMREKLIAKHIDPSKIILIRHGADLNNSSISIDDGLIADLRKGFSTIFIHAGNIGNYGAWERIVEAIAMVDNKDIGFIFVGEGQRKKDVMKLCEKLDNVRFLPYQPRENLKSILKAGDVHIITIKKNLEGLVVPSKLYPILAEKKTVLAICSEQSDTARIVIKFGCGVIADPDSSESIAVSIRELANNSGFKSYERNSMIAAQNLRQDFQLGRLLEEVEELL